MFKGYPMLLGFQANLWDRARPMRTCASSVANDERFWRWKSGLIIVAAQYICLLFMARRTLDDPVFCCIASCCIFWDPGCFDQRSIMKKHSSFSFKFWCLGTAWFCGIYLWISTDMSGSMLGGIFNSQEKLSVFKSWEFWLSCDFGHQIWVLGVTRPMPGDASEDEADASEHETRCGWMI